MTTNNISTLIGSVKQALDRRIILGNPINHQVFVLFNALKKDLEYAERQYAATSESIYEGKIETLKDKIYTLKAKCPDICYYPTYGGEGEVIDFRASNNNITIDTLKYKISQLQIIY